ncbi:MAG: hypothetical protein M1839_001680 [Geoglossum umbratile]|nr:MAG: hypothetical protein M1839_001680 [Geoglossum umbratile]
MQKERLKDVKRRGEGFGAAFDSHEDEHDPRCLQDTRVDLRRQIANWAEDPHGEHIFWLKGMAGTGKSTISRSSQLPPVATPQALFNTVAQSLEEKGRLGASFSFKRGEGDRGNASKFFTTIAAQLANSVPGLATSIARAIDDDPAIPERDLKKQVERLIRQPLSEMVYAPRQTATLVIVIDALDQCEREKDIREILRLLGQAKDVLPTRLRIFVTSRPELPIRLGFAEMSEGRHQDLVLHEVPKAAIEHDISTYLRHEFARIRAENSRKSLYKLSADWPGDENIQTLVEMAVPLFIFAATVCRFVADSRMNPKKRLSAVLEYRAASQASKLDKTYLPILHQLLVDQNKEEKDALIADFKKVVGTIIILEDPLSTVSLANLPAISEEDVNCPLDSLHSVLSVPSSKDDPVKLLHLSFRDFLLDPHRRDNSEFWVNEEESHARVAGKCLELMSREGCLKEDFNLQRPGALRAGVNRQAIDEYLPAHVRYACRYRVRHAKLGGSRIRIYDEGKIHVSPKKHFLHWLEALSLMGQIAQSIPLISTLQSLVADKSTDVSRFLDDARRFVLQNRWIVDTAPLQLYSSAIVFAPEKSIIRNMYKSRIPEWIHELPKVPSTWSPELQKLEGHGGPARAVAPPQDSRLLASASDDGTVRLWDPVTGEELRKLEGHGGEVTAVAFSYNGQLLASASFDRTVRLWDPITGEELGKFEGHSGEVTAVAFSYNSQLLVSASYDETVRLWDPSTGEELRRLNCHGSACAIAFSHDSRLLATSSGGMIRLWNAVAKEEPRNLIDHGSPGSAVAFSRDSRLLVSASDDDTVRLWSLTGEELREFECGGAPVAFSHDSQLLALTSSKKKVKLWNFSTGVKLRSVKGHSGSINAIAFSVTSFFRVRPPVPTATFSHDGQLFASASSDGTVRLWKLKTEEEPKMFPGKRDSVHSIPFSNNNQLFVSASCGRVVSPRSSVTGKVLWKLEGYDPFRAVAFSHDDRLLASTSDTETVRLWDLVTTKEPRELGVHGGQIEAVEFSHDGRLLALAGPGSIGLWNTETGGELLSLEGRIGSINAVAFSHGDRLLASASLDGTIKLWNLDTGEEPKKLEGHSDPISAITFSHDNKFLASASLDGTVRLWDPETGKELRNTEGHNSEVNAIAFSHSGQLLAAASRDKKVWLWNPETGEELQQIQLNTAVSRLSFSTNSHCLETDRGPLHLDPSLAFPNPREPQCSCPKSIFLDGDWISRNGQNLLWLPHHYRVRSVAQGNTAVIGQTPGKVTFMKFGFP